MRILLFPFLLTACFEFKNDFAVDNDKDGLTEYDGDCDDNDANVGLAECTDDDGDGFAEVDGDCDDAEALTFPGAAEADSETDCMRDLDDDGYGDVNVEGDVVAGADCDDADASVSPAGVEVCDGLDNDCNGQADENTATDVTTWYSDTDGDGFGDADTVTESCEQPQNFVENSDDCDDLDETVNPDANEECDGIDNDCDDRVDDEDDDTEIDRMTTWYADVDEDGFGNSAVTQFLCDQPVGYVDDASDCNDAVAEISPYAAEICDGIDNNCNQLIDDADSELDLINGGVLDWYQDSDNDGYGSTVTTKACEAPLGYVFYDGDCDDGSAAINPLATEICDLAGYDEDCDGLVNDGDPSVDYANSGTAFYLDDDGDGFGDLNLSVTRCAAPAGYLIDAGDCNDADAAINPDAVEVCDGLDNNCDNQIDDADFNDLDPTSTEVFYLDYDSDGYGEPTQSTNACLAPSGYVSNSDDCNDGEALAWTGATDVCDGVDNNCSGDESDAVDILTWYGDGDGDTYGDVSNSLSACFQPNNYVLISGDCDDVNPNQFPGANEFCDGFDNDCNGLVDDADPYVDLVNTGSNFYLDGDGDTYGNPNLSVLACAEPQGYVSDGTDCNDSIDTINPGVLERCDPFDVDENCNGLSDDADVDVDTASTFLFYDDLDGDGYGSDSPAYACDIADAYASNSSDCNDFDPSINPEAVEVCETLGVDEDCDGFINDDDPDIDYTATGSTWYADLDSDGHGDPNNPTVACEVPYLYTGDFDDCNDSDANIYPGQVEICDTIDNNCDGNVDDADPFIDVSSQSTYYLDYDGDGYGTPNYTQTFCFPPNGYTDNSNDCNDTEPLAWTGAAEVCDGVDNDCDGPCNGSTWDCGELDATDGDIYYNDGDYDGHVPSASQPVYACDKNEYVQNAYNEAFLQQTTPAITNLIPDYQVLGDDCDDTENRIYYGSAIHEPELCAEDYDEDGYGAVAPNSPNADPGTDCMDTHSTAYPGADEYCNQYDDNCDGEIDEIGSLDGYYYALDQDMDGAGSGDFSTHVRACENPWVVMYVWAYADESVIQYDEFDCDDNTSAITHARNVWDPVTHDAVVVHVWHLDADGDGFGSQVALDQYAWCEGFPEPATAVNNQGDCDDTDAFYTDYDDDHDGFSTCEGDCDDSWDMSTYDWEDADCDGVLTADDCDDDDPLLGDIQSDPNCVGL